MESNKRLSKRTKLVTRPFFPIGLALLLIGCTQISSIDDGSQVIEPNNEARASTGERFDDYNLVTVLPRDAISAIDDPKFISVEEANERYADDELVMGVDFNGEARAYSIPTLSSHEIVNDTVGGVKIAVTW